MSLLEFEECSKEKEKNIGKQCIRVYLPDSNHLEVSMDFDVCAGKVLLTVASLLSVTQVRHPLLLLQL